MKIICDHSSNKGVIKSFFLLRNHKTCTLQTLLAVNSLLNIWLVSGGRKLVSVDCCKISVQHHDSMNSISESDDDMR